MRESGFCGMICCFKSDCKEKHTFKQILTLCNNELNIIQLPNIQSP